MKNDLLASSPTAPLDGARIPTIAEMRNGAQLIADRVRRTPTVPWKSPFIERFVPNCTVNLKLEIFQVSGTFKPRGAFLNVLQLSPEQRLAGLAAVSAGNHAIAVSYVASQLSIPATVVMPRTAPIYRIEKCKRYGAEVILVDTTQDGFKLVDTLVADRGMNKVAPFSGELVTLGTSGVGMELCEDANAVLDLVIVPIGGGGLASGVAAAVKSLHPSCKVIGVEPVGADVMRQSIKAGRPLSISCAPTIADTLAPPLTLDPTYSICKQLLDDIVVVDDDLLKLGMAIFYEDFKLAVEPACAASLAALIGPLREEADGKNIGIIACGTNQDTAALSNYLNQGLALLYGGSSAVG